MSAAISASGGEYSFGFIPGVKNVGGIYDRLGLRTFISARAGLYNAQYRL